MIPDEGKLKLSESQNSYLGGLKLGLFTNNFTITSATVLADLTQGAWTGYSPVNLTSWATAVMVGTRASKTSNITAQFDNTSGSPQTYYGWYLYDDSAGKLIAAVNLGSQTLPDTLSAFYVPSITDTQE